jgi:hypothetical protein
MDKHNDLLTVFVLFDNELAFVLQAEVDVSCTDPELLASLVDNNLEMDVKIKSEVSIFVNIKPGQLSTFEVVF